MSVLMPAGKLFDTSVDNRQVCARGWQDYMIETRYFLGEARVDNALKDLGNPQLKRLGLTESEMLKVRNDQADALLQAA